MNHPPMASGDWQQNENTLDDQAYYQQDQQYAGSGEDYYPAEYGEVGVEYDPHGQEIMYDNQALSDIQLLAYYCSQGRPPSGTDEEALLAADATWEPVRDWLRTHSAEDVHAATGQRDETGRNAIHIACQNAPPQDVIEVFLSIASEMIQWPDQFGWLPIHYACAYGSSAGVIKCLAEAYPESKTTPDRKGRTPLHFALGTNNPSSAAVVVILSSTGAASYADDNGMLPLHYACAYGASEDCLYVLTGAFDGAITHLDGRGRTPLHFTLSNAGRPAAPSAVRLLLGLNQDLVNSKEGSPSPFRVLAEFATTLKIHQQQERASCKACLRTMLAANPTPTADFFTALQSLPDFLQELAVVTKGVQELLNFKIAQRFPTLILMLDFYVQIMVVTFYSIAVQDSVDKRFETDPKNPTIGLSLTLPLYIGASYFFLREIINFLSMLSLGALKSWAYEPSSWLTIWYVFVIYFWAYHMTEGTLDKNFFRTGSAISFAFIWTKFLSYLRNMLIDFAVFVGGVFHVMRRLAAFLICLTIILVAFSQMWTTLFQGTAFCGSENPATNATEAERIAAQQCEEWSINSWCDPWDSFLKTYTMLLGNVDEGDFEDDTLATILFVLFMFLVVILLKNVLIAIVTDSYKVIQEERAAIVFWTNRLYFIAQMDAIANGPWKTFFRKALGMKDPATLLKGATRTFGDEFWKRILDLFEEDSQDSSFMVEFLLSILVRIGVLFFVVPAWIVLGICTGGWLWPQQIREFVFTSAVAMHNSETEKEEELRRTQVVKLKAEIVTLGEEIRQELALSRTHVVQARSLMVDRKIEIQSEMKHIKRIVAMLFEQIASM